MIQQNSFDPSAFARAAHLHVLDLFTPAGRGEAAKSGHGDTRKCLGLNSI